MVKSGFEIAEQQLRQQLQKLSGHIEFPRTIKNGKLFTTQLNDFSRVVYGIFMITITKRSGNRLLSSGQSIWNQ